MVGVSFSNPSKFYMREKYESLMRGGARKVSRLHIMQWVIGSWRRISIFTEYITKTWMTVGYLALIETP